MGLGERFLHKIIHNEAMKEDPPEIYGWRVFALACSACFGGMLFGVDIGIIGGVLTLPAFTEDYGISHLSKVAKADLHANIVSTLQAGCFVGALFAVYIAEKIGRRWGLIAAAAVAIVGCVLQAGGSGVIAVMYVGRFLAGLGVGAASMVCPLYVSENAPRAIRGGLTGIYQLFVSHELFEHNYRVTANFLADCYWCHAGLLDQLWLASTHGGQGNLQYVLDHVP